MKLNFYADVFIFCSGNKPNKTKIDCGNEVKAMEFAPDFEIPDVSRKSTSLLAVGLREGGIKIWDTDTGLSFLLPFKLLEFQNSKHDLSVFHLCIYNIV